MSTYPPQKFLKLSLILLATLLCLGLSRSLLFSIAKQSNTSNGVATIITGTVLENDNGSQIPVPNVNIFVINQDTNQVITNIQNSDVNGEYSVTLPISGSYEAVFTPPQGLNLAPVRTEWNSPLPTDFITPTDIILPEGFGIQGNVTLPNGSPAEGIRFFFQNTSTGEGYGTEESDQDGNFFASLPPGNHDLSLIVDNQINTGSVIIKNISELSQLPLMIQLPSGHQVRGIAGCHPNSFILAIPINDSVPVGDITKDFGTFADSSGAFNIGLQAGTYNFIIDPPGSSLPNTIIEDVKINQPQLLLNQYCRYLPFLGN